MQNTRIMSTKTIINMLLVCALALAACSPAILPGAPADDATPTTPTAAQDTVLPAGPVPTPTPLPALEAITPANAGLIREVGAIMPSMPPSFHISADGSTLAIGGAGGIRVLDAATGTERADIPLTLPDCAFGMGRYFRLSADGGFIAVVTDAAVQVWQVGGGRIYDAPISRRYNTDPALCGADIPQLALSPDGMTLVVSRVELARTSAKKTFQVMDIPTNTALSEWVVKGAGPQGKLYDYGTAGFSQDGTVLMTFDPARFRIRIDGLAAALSLLVH